MPGLVGTSIGAGQRNRQGGDRTKVKKEKKHIITKLDENGLPIEGESKIHDGKHVD